MASQSEQGDLHIVNGEDNRIDSVVVFSQQAYVTRKVKALVQAGVNRLLVDVQAFSVDPESAQAEVFGKGEVLGVQYKEIPVKHAPQDDVRALDQQRRDLKYKRQRLDGAIDATTKQRTYLEGVVDFSSTEIAKKLKTELPDPEGVSGMVGFLGERFIQLSEESTSLQQQLDELDYEISVVERKLKTIRRGGSEKQRVIEILFEAAADQELSASVSYMTRNVSWQPFYRVDVPLDLSGLQMTQFARIKQTTGEEWDLVRLTVSNATPMQGAELPDIYSWRLQQPHPAMLLGAVPVAAAAEEVFGGSADGAVFEDELDLDEVTTLEEPADMRVAERHEQTIAFEYEIPRQIDLPADGSETLLPLSRKDLEGNFYYYSTPRQDPLTYLVCEMNVDREFLPGGLNVHFGGRFVSRTRLAESQAGVPMRLNLGVDRGVSIKREIVTDKLAETFLGKVDRNTVARELEYRIVVENNKDEAVSVQLLDSTPIATTDKIQVKILELKPEPRVRDWQEREGVMAWELELSPGQSQEVRCHFFVKHPKEWTPDGL